MLACKQGKMSDLSKQGSHQGRNKDNTTQVIFCKYLATSVIFSISEVQGLVPDCIVAICESEDPWLCEYLGAVTQFY